MKNAPIFALMFLIVLPLAFSQVEPIYNSKYLDLSLTLDSFVTLVPESSDYEIQSVTTNLSFIPLETWRQDVQSLDPVPTAAVSPDSVVFEWQNPIEKKLGFSLQSKVRTLNDFKKVKSKIRFPLESIPDEIRVYTQPSEKIDSNNAAVIAKANELAAGEDDLFVVAHKLAEFVHDEVNYSLSTVTSKAALPASWVLEHKEGVCDEISVLFIALSRALGIPARFVSGISYTNSDLFTEKWGPHGWAEVYFPGYDWVPFDVTYDELGFIDASHIESKVSADPSEASLRYRWKGRNINLNTSDLNNKVRVLGYGPKMDDFVRISVDVVKQSAGFGSYNLVEADIENLRDYYVTTTVFLSKTNDLGVIEPYKTPILLKPGERKAIFWTIKVNPDLNSDYIYTFPIQITTIQNITAETQFTSKRGDPVFEYQEIKTIMLSREIPEEKEVSKDISLNCTSDKQEYFSGDNAVLGCIVQNKGNFPIENLQVCRQDSCQRLNMGIGEETSFDFIVKTSGAGKIDTMITASNADILKSTSIQFDVLDEPSILIKDVNYPATTEYRKPFEISFLLEKESYSDPQGVTIRLLQNGIAQEWNVDELTQNRKIVVSFSGTELSMKNNFDIVVTYHDKKGKEYSSRESFAIGLVNVNPGQRVIILFKDLLRNIQKIFA